MTDKTVAVEILKQLGGGRFIAMTGAKNLTCANDSMQCKIGRNSKSVNYINIILNGMDTYDMEFLRLRKGEFKKISEANGIYNDQLQEIFTEHTGMYTSL